MRRRRNEVQTMTLDTREARDAIFARIRASQGRDESGRAAENVLADQYLQAHPRGPQPAFCPDLTARFIEQALRLSITFERVARQEDAPAACARYLQGQSLVQRAACWPVLSTLDWAGAGIAADLRSANPDDLVGITGSFCGVAETGTLLLLSSPQTPPRNHLLPETYIALLNVDRIVATMEDAFDLARNEHARLPRATNFVSGPSRTADIEQTIVLGAHGPYRQHIILIGGV
jgi:L-lactate dehydrogenase complex protein LldG